eukprot:scaffold148224_cov36-Prasinocladus_malaysianus.AAC.3
MSLRSLASGVDAVGPTVRGDLVSLRQSSVRANSTTKTNTRGYSSKPALTLVATFRLLSARHYA